MTYTDVEWTHGVSPASASANTMQGNNDHVRLETDFKHVWHLAYPFRVRFLQSASEPHPTFNIKLDGVTFDTANTSASHTGNVALSNDTGVYILSVEVVRSNGWQIMATAQTWVRALPDANYLYVWYEVGEYGHHTPSTYDTYTLTDFSAIVTRESQAW